MTATGSAGALWESLLRTGPDGNASLGQSPAVNGSASANANGFAVKPQAPIHDDLPVKQTGSQFQRHHREQDATAKPQLVGGDSTVSGGAGTQLAHRQTSGETPWYLQDEGKYLDLENLPAGEKLTLEIMPKNWKNYDDIKSLLEYLFARVLSLEAENQQLRETGVTIITGWKTMYNLESKQVFDRAQELKQIVARGEAALTAQKEKFAAAANKALEKQQEAQAAAQRAELDKAKAQGDTEKEELEKKE